MAAVPSVGRAVRVERPAARESDAARDLYERFSGQIYGYCLHQLGSREEAEDAVQTTFMNAFRGLQRGIVPAVESAWLFKIAHNVCLSRRRSTRRRGKVESPNNMEVLQEVIPARERTGDELMRLQDALEQMPESQRRAILLREWQGLSYREIARELDLSQSAVETLIFRARRTLASGLEVEPEGRSWRKRARHSVDAGSLLAAVKALLTGGTAVKVAATVAVATTAAVAVSVGHHRAAVRAEQRHVSKVASVAADHGHVVAARRFVSVETRNVQARPRPAVVARTAHRITASRRATASPAPAGAVQQPLSTSSEPSVSPAESEQHIGPGSAVQQGNKQDQVRSRPTPQPQAKGNSGNGKQPPQRATQSEAKQSAPQTGGTSPGDGNGKHDGGSGNGGGSGGDGGDVHK